MISVCGSSVERSQLPMVVERPERAGRFWRGVPHKDLADSLVKACEVQDVEVERETWVVGKKGAGLVGGLDVRIPGLTPPAGQTFSIAYIGANDLSKSNRIACGTNVMVCNNGVCTGTFVLQRKHTIHFDIGVEMNMAMQLAIAEFNKTNDVVRALQERELDKYRIDRAFMEVGRQGVLSWSGVGKAWKQYENPAHDEFRKFRGRAWGIYQAANEAIKQRNPIVQVEGLNTLTSILRAA